MKTWKLYIENKKSDKEEKEEEKHGLDLDHDNESGESKEHKSKVKKAKEEMLDFFEKRKIGAAKIASEAKAKGGPAELTAWHFAVKASAYTEVLTAIRSNRDEQFYISKCRALVSKLKFGKIDQKDFQEIMGKLEVFGEALAKLFE